MKVSFVKRHLSSGGGLEKYTRVLADAFCERGCDVSLLCQDLTHPLDKRIAIEKVDIPWSFSKLKGFDKGAKKWLKEHPQDIVFGMCRTSEQTHMRAGNGVHLAYIEMRKQIDPWIKRNTYFLNRSNQAILDLEKKGFENPSLRTLFTNSNMVKDEVLRFYNVEPEKIEVIHNGVEHRAFQEEFDQWGQTRADLLKERALSADLHHFLFIGNGYFRKGLLPLMRSLAAIPHRHFHLHVIGKEKNITYFRKEAKRLKIDKQITFLGPQPHVAKFYALADTLVIPSYYDPFANVTVEALAMGVFVISSLTNGGSEVITPENGAIIPSLFDQDSFTEVLRKRLDSKKNMHEAQTIRLSIAHLDFEIQLNKMIDRCLIS